MENNIDTSNATNEILSPSPQTTAGHQKSSVFVAVLFGFVAMSFALFTDTFLFPIIFGVIAVILGKRVKSEESKHLARAAVWLGAVSIITPILLNGVPAFISGLIN